MWKSIYNSHWQSSHWNVGEEGTKRPSGPPIRLRSSRSRTQMGTICHRIRERGRWPRTSGTCYCYSPWESAWENVDADMMTLLPWMGYWCVCAFMSREKILGFLCVLFLSLTVSLYVYPKDMYECMCNWWYVYMYEWMNEWIYVYNICIWGNGDVLLLVHFDVASDYI